MEVIEMRLTPAIAGPAILTVAAILVPANP
jgi:hypothetical protein